MRQIIASVHVHGHDRLLSLFCYTVMTRISRLCSGARPLRIHAVGEYYEFTYAWRVHAGAQSIHAYILCTLCMMLRWSSVGDVAARLRALTMSPSCTPFTILGATDPAARPVCLVCATFSRPRSIRFFLALFHSRRVLIQRPRSLS